MNPELDKLTKAKLILAKMAKGINPVNGEALEEGNFLSDPRMKRCLLYVCGILDNEIDRKLDSISRKICRFVITAEEKSRVVLPEGNIAISEFARCVNEVIDKTRSKKLNAFEMNNQLKKIGILSEVKSENGKSRTALNEKSRKYGIVTERRTSKGREYDAIVFNDAGKKFLLDNLEKIMDYKR